MARVLATEVNDSTVEVDRNPWSGSLSLHVDGERVGFSFMPVIWNTIMYMALFVLGYALGVGWI